MKKKAIVFEYLARHPGATSDQIAEETGLKPKQVREALWSLSQDGQVAPVGKLAVQKCGNTYIMTQWSAVGSDGNPVPAAMDEDSIEADAWDKIRAAKLERSDRDARAFISRLPAGPFNQLLALAA